MAVPITLLLVFLGVGAQASPGNPAVSSWAFGRPPLVVPPPTPPPTPSDGTAELAPEPEPPATPGPSVSAQPANATSSAAPPASVVPPASATATTTSSRVGAPAMVGTESAASAQGPAPGSGPTRPRLEVAVAMGLSIDGSGDGHVAVPAFGVQAGAGDGIAGFEARMFSTQAAGRHQMVPDRLGVDVMVALRPLARRYSGDDARWSRRCLRSLTLNLGLGIENASLGQQAVFRSGTLVGGHFDLPLTGAADPSELRIRIGARRMFAGAGRAGTVLVSDSNIEAFAGLAVVF